MAAKPETIFITSVHRHLPDKKVPHREKMCNPYSSGTADVWYSGNADIWVEYKFIKVPARDATPVQAELSELQKDWLRGRHKEGRKVFVVIGCKDGGVILSNLDWEKPMPAADFKKRTMSRHAVAAWILKTTQGATDDPIRQRGVQDH